MDTPWPLIGWVLLVVLGLTYIGGVLEVWSGWCTERTDADSRRAVATGYLLALIWPFSLGAALVRWMGGLA